MLHIILVAQKKPIDAIKLLLSNRKICSSRMPLKKTQNQLQNSLSDQGEIDQFPGFQNFGFVIITDINLFIVSVTKNIEKFLNEPIDSFIA